MGAAADFIIPRQGPHLAFIADFWARHREFWNMCLVGVLIDEAPLSFACMSSIIQSAWHLQGSVSVVGMLHHCYIFKFENAADMKVLKDNSPMAIKNKLLVLESWTPNFDYEHYVVESFPIWVQIICLKTQLSLWELL